MFDGAPPLELASASLAAGSCGSLCGTIRRHLITPPHATKYPKPRIPINNDFTMFWSLRGCLPPTGTPAASTCDNYT
jgi:hypothetical protein